MRRNATPSRCWRSMRRLTTCDCVDMSSALTGSSAMISFGFQRERAGDCDALPLTARELRREAAEMSGAHADLLEQRDDLVLALLAAHVEVHLERLTHDVGHGRQRIERLVRILEHHLHVAGAHPQLLALSPSTSLPSSSTRPARRAR